MTINNIQTFFRSSVFITGTSQFEAIPKDLVFEIAKHTPDIDLLALSQTCKTIHVYLSENSFWFSLSKYREITVLAHFNEHLFGNAKRWYYSERNLGVKQYKSKQKYRSLKVVMVGTEAVGKSQIASTLVDDPFQSKYTPTLGVEYKSQCWKYRNTAAHVHIWDIGGDEPHQSIVKTFAKNAQLVLLVYSVRNRASFEKMEKLLKPVFNHKAQILVATHIDEPRRQVSFEEGLERARKHSMYYVEVSAKTGKGIVLLRRRIMQVLLGMKAYSLNTDLSSKS